MMTRRRFAVLLAAVAAGCERQREKTRTATAPASQPATQASGVLDAGPSDDFKSDDVYTDLRDQGVFIIRRDEKLFAISSVCTHKGCKVRVAADQSFYCKCHGSTFDRNGKVIKGPATRDLPRLSVTQDDSGHLLVKK